MTNHPNPLKQARVLGALALAGLLTTIAARADVMNFYNASFLGGPVNTLYEPITNLHVTYSSVSVFNGYGVDHTTSSSSAPNFYTWQNYYIVDPSGAYPDSCRKPIRSTGP